MKEKPRNIALRARETADAYALKTLFHEIRPRFPNDNIYFSVHADSNSARKIVEKYPLLKKGYIQPDFELPNSNPNLVIQVMSDTTEDLSRYEHGPYRSLIIDAALLKSMRRLPTQEELELIKGEHGLKNLDKPLAVMGWLQSYEDWSHGNEEEKRRIQKEKEQARELIKLLAQHAHLVTTPPRCDFPILNHYNLDEKTLENITEITPFGQLARLYAIADIAFSGFNLRQYGGQLNNFYEQSQGGPFLLVPTQNTSQYGYLEFVNQGLVIPCQNIEEIAQQSLEFLQRLKGDPKLKEHHKQKWLAHRERTREQFLPEIFDRIEFLLNSGKKKRIFTYVHPESDWDGNYFGKNPEEIFGEDYKERITGGNGK